MKKISILMAVILVITCLAACSKQEEPAAAEPSAAATEAPTAAATQAAAPSPEPTEAAVVTEAPVVTEEPVPTEEITPEPTAEPESTAEPAAEDVELSVVFDAYKQMVSEYIDQNLDKLYELELGLIYVNNDAIPELFLVENPEVNGAVGVYGYVNGAVEPVGYYGRDSSMGYDPRANFILTAYNDEAGSISTVKTFDLSGGAENQEVNEYVINEADGSFLVNGEPVDEQTYQDAVNTIYSEHPMMNYVNYGAALKYYPNIVLNDNSFIQMYETSLMNDEILRVYHGPEMEYIIGSWELNKFELNTKDGSFFYSNNDTELNNCRAYSSLSFDSDIAGFWITAYNDEFDTVYDASDYAMMMQYSPLGISDGIDYGWNVELLSENEGVKYFATMPDEDTVILVGYIDRPDGEMTEWGVEQDTFVAEYNREYNGGLYYEMLAEIEQDAANSTDEMLTFTVKPMLSISAYDTALIAAYGLPEDLDGYDFELVYVKDVEPFTICIDSNVELFALSEALVNVKTDLAGYKEKFTRPMPVYIYYDRDAIDSEMSDSVTEYEAVQLYKPIAVKEAYVG